MKKLFFIMMLFTSLSSFAQNLPADKIIGTWQSVGTDVDLKFEIFRSGDKYYGKLLHASTMYEADGKTPKKDFKNPDEKLRDRSRKGIVNVTNLTFDDGEYTEGKLYNPDDGNTYSINASLKNANELNFRAYYGISLLGRTMKLKRIQ